MSVTTKGILLEDGTIAKFDFDSMENVPEFILKEEMKDYPKKEEVPSKPEDIGAQPKGNYLTEAPVTSVNGKVGNISLSAQDVSAEPSGTSNSAVTAHNTNPLSHEDIRLLISGLTTRLNALANSTDEDLDQMAELVAYIHSNRNLIDSITTSKVSVADIIDNLSTSVSNKPLSAKQGVALKSLIDGLSTSKLDSSELSTAINTALAQAKASGDFKGDPGKTPVKGVDYYTEADKTEMVNAVISALPKWTGGSY